MIGFEFVLRYFDKLLKAGAAFILASEIMC